MSAVPDADELRAFLYRMIAEARLMNELARVDDLLDKLNNAEELRAFMACVLGVDTETESV